MFPGPGIAWAAAVDGCRRRDVTDVPGRAWVAVVDGKAKE